MSAATARANLPRGRAWSDSDSQPASENGSQPASENDPKPPLSDVQLSHGARAADYEWRRAKRKWYCIQCQREATNEHCNSKKHIKCIEWYGAGSGFNAEVRNESRELPPHCMANNEEPNMYVYLPDRWNWRCQVCDSIATEEHCNGQKHRKNVIFCANTYRDGPRSTNGLQPASLSAITPARWTHQVNTLGLDAQTLQQCFRAPSSSIPIAHVMDFTESERPPALPQVMSFWGDVYCVMRETIKELIRQGSPYRGLWYFYDNESDWYNAQVWSNADKATTKHSMDAREEGLWWPCIAVDLKDGTVATYCQDFALQQSKKAWITDRSRVWRFVAPPPPPLPPTSSRVEIESVASSEASENGSQPATTSEASESGLQPASQSGLQPASEAGSEASYHPYVYYAVSTRPDETDFVQIEPRQRWNRRNRRER